MSKQDQVEVSTETLIEAPIDTQANGMTRRGFMVGSMGAGVAMAFVPMALLSGCAEEVLTNQQFEPTVWYSIQPSGAISVKITKAEMGQHVGTALARIVAEELEADWNDVSIDYVDTDAKYGTYITGGSWSVFTSFDQLSRAGAAGRVTLIEAAAKLMNVAPADCRAQSSVVICGDRQMSFGDIVARAEFSQSYTDEQLASLPLKPAKDRNLIGVDTPARDVPAKADGSAVYGIDANYEGMVYAKPLLPPTRYGSVVQSIEDSAAQNVAGYQQTLALDDASNSVPGWVLVIADSYHAAQRAARLVEVQWQAGSTTQVSEADLLARGDELIDSGAGALVLDDEAVGSTFAAADRVIEARYTTNTALHFQLEPVNAIGLQKDGIWELHTGAQWQSLSMPVYAQALGVPQDKIVMRTHLLGGGFGRRLNGDYGVPALLAAQALGKPVKVVLSREDDSRFDSVRSPSVQHLSMAFDAQHNVLGMQHAASAGWPTAELAAPLLGTAGNGEKYDPFAINGADHWYAVGVHRVRAVMNDLAQQTFRPGWLRSVAPGWINWASESFMDEAAHEAGVDPLEFRRRMLTAEGHNAGAAPASVGGAKRMANVLNRAAAKAGWGKTMPAGEGMGLACTFGQERNMPTWTACVAEVAVDVQSGKVKLNKLTVVIDAGSIVHPDGALAQTEGAALWGASLALHEGTEFVDGQVKDTNLDGYRPMRMGDVPELDIEFVASDHHPVGLGEPATTVVGPAIGNAIFAATGARVRHLPIRPDDVKAAMG